MLCSVNSNEENYKLDRFEHNRSSSSSMSKTFQVPCPGQIAPESARDSYDAIYYAKVLYLEVGRRLSEVKKMKVCSGLSYEKLSFEGCSHLARNKNFPSKSPAQALIT
ncbi:hypothetical protein KY290_031792 [Solanum tuberosum]|uniref:NPH3 domain-containing protein n=1 Tax=Solanum tuberosum TaxID=4113 RepID=A0ABQ7UA86_SOLTU|nr:hypothetical protein KY289_031192 [Solanum tuberosum]KAH0743799.1 hypothetical protein KY290_031792 [Solanum tuberosum]